MEKLYIIKKDSNKYAYLVLTDENKYEWGSKKDAIDFDREYAEELQRSLAFKTVLILKQEIIKMSNVALLYNQNKRNMTLRRKMENEMFINRSISQEAAYKYITEPRIPIKTKNCSLIPLVMFIGLFVIYVGSLIVK